MNQIAPEIWCKVRRDYVHGAGSVAVVAAKHGLKCKTVAKCAAREHWTKLRDDFAARQLGSLTNTAASTPNASVPEGQLRAIVQALLHRLITGREVLQQHLLTRITRPGLTVAERQRYADDYLAISRDWLAFLGAAADLGLLPSQPPAPAQCAPDNTDRGSC